MSRVFWPMLYVNASTLQKSWSKIIPRQRISDDNLNKIESKSDDVGIKIAENNLNNGEKFDRVLNRKRRNF